MLGIIKKIFKNLIWIIGVISVIGIISAIIFIKFVPHSQKSEILSQLKIENTGFARDLAKEAFLKIKINSYKKNFLGDKWKINGLMYSTNKSMNFTSQKIKFKFSDYDEIMKFRYRINGSQVLGRPFFLKIPGHKNAQFLGAEVLEVN